ncbi:MAG: hypothetical protein LKM31_05815 [Sphingobium sp.]|jgi:hypothetical protein|nr:hypothetical protein [Sphingobium sp.]
MAISHSLICSAAALALTLTIATQGVGTAFGQSEQPQPPVAPAELGDGPIDETAQLGRIRAALKDHYRLDNEDTRFFIDRNDRGFFRATRNIGLVYKRVPGATDRVQFLGSATLISPCFALTAYHVVHGTEGIDDEQFVPSVDAKVEVGIFPTAGQSDQFDKRHIEATAVDPGIINLRARVWSDDFLLLRLHEKQISYLRTPVTLGHIFDRRLSRLPWQSSDEFLLAAGFATDRIALERKIQLQGDFCQPRGANAGAGVYADCILTKGMSGGAVFLFFHSADGRFQSELVGVPTQPSIGNGLFAKNSNGRSLVAPLTPTKIAKIRAIIDRPTDDHCMPTDGKPW